MDALLEHDFDWQSGRVAHWDLDKIEDESWLKEDLAMIEFPAGVCLDVGWYVSTFMILIVRDDWTNPLFRRRVKDVDDLERELRAAIKLAHKHALTP
jgi:hypothetical protein